VQPAFQDLSGRQFCQIFSNSNAASLIGESADAVWKQLQRQQAEVFGVRAVETSQSEMEAEPRERDVPEVIIPPPAPIPAVVTQLLMFGMSHEAVQRRKAAHRPSSPVTASDQLGLFPA
jgi:hypothetical protein